MGEFKQVLVAVYFFCNYIFANENGEPCGQQELVSCSKQLKALSETSEFNFIINKEELERLCPDLHLGLECIRSYSRRCMSQNQRAHFNKLYYGTNEMISELCKEGDFQEAYLKHSPCMKKVKVEYDDCAQNYKRIMQRLQSGNGGGSEVLTTTTITATMATTTPRFMQINLMKRQQELNSVSHETTSPVPVKKNLTDAIVDHGEHQIEQTVCCAFKKYIECSEIVIRKACGAASAEFTRIFLDKMLSSLMRMHCEKESHHCEEFASLNNHAVVEQVKIHLMLMIVIVVVTFAL